MVTATAKRKKQRILHGSWPCDQDCGHTGLYASLINASLTLINVKTQGDECLNCGLYSLLISFVLSFFLCWIACDILIIILVVCVM